MPNIKFPQIVGRFNRASGQFQQVKTSGIRKTKFSLDGHSPSCHLILNHPLSMPKIDLKKVEAERNRLSALLGNAKLREEKKSNRKLIGKCFVYMNTYGVADGMKRWPLYISIDRMNRNGTLYGLKFEQSTRDRIEIETNHYCHHVSPGNDYREITRAEFNKALKSLKTTVNKL